MQSNKETVDQVKKVIKQLGLKKIHVAKRIGCSPQELTHFLSGRRKLRDDCMGKLSAYLGI